MGAEVCYLLSNLDCMGSTFLLCLLKSNAVGLVEVDPAFSLDLAEVDTIAIKLFNDLKNRRDALLEECLPK